VNFYKHHLGDYDGATAHLSWSEDMAYTRLLRTYYRREKPFADVAEACRLTRATTKPEREAISAMLSEFFTEEADGWHNKRADEEVAAYQAQASTNRRIARERTVQRTVNETPTNRSTKRIPNQNQNQNQNHKPEPEKTKTGRKTRALAPLPEGWKPSQARAETLEKEFSLPKGGIDRYLEAFTDACRSKGYEYQDFDAAFANCVRQDWPKFRANGTMKPRQKTAGELIDEAEAERTKKTAQGQSLEN